VYEGVRLAVQGGLPQAVAHGRRIIALEHSWHIAVDSTVNAYVTSRPLLAVPACFAYATLHDAVTLGVLVWLWRRRPLAYPTARTALVIATLVGLAGFWLLPVAPPRMMPGFTDTMLVYGHYGWWGDAASAPRGAGGLTNQFAAMPSLHVGWAVWCGWKITLLARSRWLRVLGAVYPAFIIWVVVGTANHYVLDAIAGLVVIVFGLLCAWAIRRWQATRRRGHTRAGGPPAGRPPASDEPANNASWRGGARSVSGGP
jgi:hypothetical protein